MASDSPNRFRTEEDAEHRITDRVIRLSFLALFAYLSLTLVLPFLGIAVWAVILAVALHPLYERLRAALGGRSRLAALIITTLAFLVVAGPIGLLATSLVETVMGLAANLRDGTLTLPPPPPRLANLPAVGEPVLQAWTLASTNIEAALAEYGPSLRPAGTTLLLHVAAISKDLVLLLVSVVISGVLLSKGRMLADGARRFLGRLVAPRGAHFVDLAGATIRSVSRGVVGLAFLEALLAGVAMLLAGVPAAGFLAFLVLLLCIVQIGPVLILLPVAVWAWSTISTGAALILTAVFLLVIVADNVAKPVLLARGLTTPMLVILAGVIGGTLSYGMVGLFLGPVALAVFYELLVAWVQMGSVPPHDEPEGSMAASTGGEEPKRPVG